MLTAAAKNSTPPFLTWLFYLFLDKSGQKKEPAITLNSFIIRHISYHLLEASKSISVTFMMIWPSAELESFAHRADGKYENGNWSGCDLFLLYCSVISGLKERHVFGSIGNLLTDRLLPFSITFTVALQRQRKKRGWRKHCHFKLCCILCLFSYLLLWPL